MGEIFPAYYDRREIPTIFLKNITRNIEFLIEKNEFYGFYNYSIFLILGHYIIPLASVRFNDLLRK